MKIKGSKDKNETPSRLDLEQELHVSKDEEHEGIINKLIIVRKVSF